MASGGATVVPQLSVKFTLKEKTMSNWFVAALLCVAVLAMGGWADDKPTAKPDDKDKKPAFRAGAVRYQVKDVNKSVEFYTKHLGFKVDERYPVAPAFAAVSN